ncbi:hypothetical protein KKI23_00185 [Patescibacteria group bacterium]|nr:hypothetical protein [Patescibacteria group bacterium]
MTIYRSIFVKAWEITRRYKFLWFFGFFAALLGNGGELEIIYQNIVRFTQQSNNLSFLSDLYNAGRLEAVFSQVSQYFNTDTPLTIANSILLLLVFVLFIWLIVIAQSVIINKVYKQEKGEVVAFDESFRVGRHFFKKVFLVNLAAKVLVYGLFAIICGPLLYFYLRGNGISWGLSFSYILISFIIFIPVGFVVAFIAKYATAFVVIKGLSVSQAMKEGWKLFVNNWLISIEMSVTLFIINVIAGLAFLVAFVLVAVPFLLLAMIFYSAASAIGLNIITIIGSVVFLAALFLLGSIFSVFQFSAWTLLFMKLNQGKVISKIVRIFSSSQS